MDDAKNKIHTDTNTTATHHGGGVFSSVADDNISMEDLLKENISAGSIPHLHPGDIVEGVFVGKTSDGYLFDIGHKREGFVPFKEENIPEKTLAESIARPIKLKVIKPSTLSQEDDRDGGNPLLSWRGVRMEEVLVNLQEAYKNKSPIKGTITKKIKGGYLASLGEDGSLVAFLPGNHISIKRKNGVLSRQIECVILEINNDERTNKDGNVQAESLRIVVSEKESEKIIRRKSLENIFNSKTTGDIAEGTITSLTKFGAFADIGGADALIHISDISWSPVDKIEDFLKVGQKIKARIKTMERATGKISLSIKELTPNPWETIGDKFSVGDTIQVKVRNITPFGVFCELPDSGVEGLLHISEVDWKNPHPDLPSLFKKDDILKVKIVMIDPARRKVSLSVKQLEPSPWEKLAGEIYGGKEIEGVISRLTPFGAIVKVGESLLLEGTLHLKNLDWLKKISNPSDILRVGDRLTLKVLEFNPAQERMELSLKHTKPNPFIKYKKKTIVEFTVAKVIPSGAFVTLAGDAIEAFVPRAELTRHKSDDIMTLIKPGDKLKGVVTESDETRRKIEISVRKYEIAEEKKLLAKYSPDNPRPKLEDLLEEAE